MINLLYRQIFTMGQFPYWTRIHLMMESILTFYAFVIIIVQGQGGKHGPIKFLSEVSTGMFILDTFPIYLK